MVDSLTADGILLIVESGENLVGLAEMICGGVPREEKVPDKEQTVYEGPELYHTEVVGALCIFAGPEAEIEANGEQVGDMVVFGVGGASCRGDDGVQNSQGGGLFPSDGVILKPVGLELSREALVEPGVCLRVG